MLDAVLGRWTRSALSAAALWLPLKPWMFSVAALVLGLAALPAIYLGAYRVSIGLLLASRPLSILATTKARAVGDIDMLAGNCLFDVVVFSGVPFAFALGDPTRALAAVFLIFAMSVNTASQFAFADADGPGRGLIGNLEILIGFGLACVFPDQFPLVAYVLGVLCFVAAGMRIAPVKGSL